MPTLPLKLTVQLTIAASSALAAPCPVAARGNRQMAGTNRGRARTSTSTGGSCRRVATGPVLMTVGMMTVGMMVAARMTTATALTSLTGSGAETASSYAPTVNPVVTAAHRDRLTTTGFVLATVSAR
jgi:hypothetical protein